MSYILEALKKAQAERQLGNAPTIHAPTLGAVPQEASGRKPLVIGFAAGAVLVAGALFAWRQQGAAPEKVADAGPASLHAAPAGTASASQSAPAMAAPASVAPSTAAPGVPAVPAAPANPVPVASTAQVALVQESASGAVSRESRQSRVQAEPQKRPAKAVEPAASPTVAAARPAAAAPAATIAPARPATHEVAPPVPAARATAAVASQPAAAPSPYDNLRPLNELPESIRFNVPRVTFGGYMYSPNPADSLVLIDRVLRREGEEVAPGLVLEKVLPKAAVMNYRGNRYRVPL